MGASKMAHCGKSPCHKCEDLSSNSQTLKKVPKYSANVRGPSVSAVSWEVETETSLAAHMPIRLA